MQAGGRASTVRAILGLFPTLVRRLRRLRLPLGKNRTHSIFRQGGQPRWRATPTDRRNTSNSRSMVTVDDINERSSGQSRAIAGLSAVAGGRRFLLIGPG